MHPGSATGRSTTAGGSTKVITAQVGQQLAAAKLGHVRTVIPEVTGNVTVSSTTTSQASITVIGTTPEYFTVGTNRVDSGTAFTNADMTSAGRVAVIGSTLAGELFPGSTALRSRFRSAEHRSPWSAFLPSRAASGSAIRTRS